MDEQKPLVKISEKHRSTLHISLMAWNVALSFFYFGYCLIYLGALPFDTVMRIYKIEANKGVAQGILNGCIPIGALVGSVGSSCIIQRFSRKNNLLFTNLIAFILGGLIYIPNYYSFIMFRFFQGICVGIFSALIPMTIRQFSPVSISGRLGTFAQINVTVGILVAYLLTYSLKKITGDLECQSFWYIIFGVPGVVIIVQTFILLFVFPYETPKYLLLKNEEAKAIKVLQVIYKPEYVQEVLEEKKRDLMSLRNISDTIITETSEPSKKTAKLAIIMAVHVAAMQQLSGVNALNIYCGPILNSATTAEVAMLIPTLMATQKLLTTFTTSLIITRFGRKTLLEIGLFLEALGVGMIAIGFAFQDQDQQQFDHLIIVGLFLFMGVFGLTLGPLTWVYIAETVEPSYVPLATGSNWTAASLVIVLFPILKQNFLNGNPAIAFVFFTAYNLLSLIICRFFLLETKDKTQRQIRQEYMDYKIC